MFPLHHRFVKILNNFKFALELLSLLLEILEFADNIKVIKESLEIYY